ncbi:MAG: ribosomal-processing cysteine protease Prp [Defluviitaleaceae bacterium]|nr:ribosomal-processing cysteine protease Prp [Defluviitaleaceae bacterium]
MIKITFYLNADKNICGFDVLNHGETNVCAAISVLTLNTFNSLETFVDEPIICDYNPKGGFLSVKLPNIQNGSYNELADLLLKSLQLGVQSVNESYPHQIKIKTKYPKK